MEETFWGFNITPLACNPSIFTITTTSQKFPWGFPWVVGAWCMYDCQRVTWGMFVFTSCKIWVEQWKKPFEASIFADLKTSFLLIFAITTTSLNTSKYSQRKSSSCCGRNASNWLEGKSYCPKNSWERMNKVSVFKNSQKLVTIRNFKHMRLVG